MVDAAGAADQTRSLDGLKLPKWGSLRLALPLGGNSDAAYLAGEAVAAASAPQGAPPTDGSGAVRTLIGGQPKLADNSLAEAMNALLRPEIRRRLKCMRWSQPNSSCSRAAHPCRMPAAR